MKTRLAFVGFQHPHVWDVVARAAAHPGIEIVAMCEEDATTRESLAGDNRVSLTHADYRAMLAEVPCDAVVVGDWFARRGRIVIDCLAAGRHVLADKPLCTSLAEYGEIVRLSTARGLAVGLMLDLRDAGIFIRVRELVRAGEIGEIRAVAFGGQHPLLTGRRPAWYHEAGKHGGTINDIAVHGFDLVPWITGLALRRVHGARAWAAGVPAGSHLVNAAQCLLELENGAGVVCDVSYFSPDSHGYTLPMYWRLTLWGSRGVLEASLTAKEIVLYREGESAGRTVPIAVPNPGGYLTAFLDEVGRRSHDGLTTNDVFRASRAALLVQEIADRGGREGAIGGYPVD
jgi:predicted dehydrogenase